MCWKFKNKSKDFSLRRVVTLTEKNLILLSENELNEALSELTKAITSDITPEMLLYVPVFGHFLSSTQGYFAYPIQ